MKNNMSEKYDTFEDEMSDSTSTDDDEDIATTSQTTSDSEVQVCLQHEDLPTTHDSTGWPEQTESNLGESRTGIEKAEAFCNETTENSVEESYHSREISTSGSTINGQKEEIDNTNQKQFEKNNSDGKRTSSPDSNMCVVAMHYNELKEAGRTERVKSKIFFMRNFNNWIKGQLIHEYLNRIKQQQHFGDPMRVLDMCCGKGGDLLKWEKANITHLICTDIAEISLEQCKRRYNDIIARADKSKFGTKFTAEFFACDSTLVRLRQRYKDASLKLNLVSCQFAFHYSFESLSQADCMVRNAAECLQEGGYFIATIPDAYEIMRRLRCSTNGKSFGNDVYNIEFSSQTNPPPLFGAKYQFHLEGVVDCPEFLVHFETLVKLCRKHGLNLHRKTSFADYCKESLLSGRQLLQRMNGLEKVHINRCGRDEQFAHVRSKFGTSRSRVLGTLSKAEWEATTLYMICAFKKCKSHFDSEGKPVFIFD